MFKEGYGVHYGLKTEFKHCLTWFSLEMFGPSLDQLSRTVSRPVSTSRYLDSSKIIVGKWVALLKGTLGKL